jgi:hypothetical protein
MRCVLQLYVALLVMQLGVSHAQVANVNQAADPCAPVPGSTFWTLDEINANEYFRNQLEKKPGARVIEPALGPRNAAKYGECRRQVFMTDAWIANELAQNYWAVSGAPKRFEDKVEFVLGLTGMTGTIVGSTAARGLSSMFFSDRSDAEFPSLIRGVLQNFQRQHPERSIPESVDALIAQMKAMNPPLDAKTIEHFQTEARWQAYRLEADARMNGRITAGTTTGSIDELKTSLRGIDSGIKKAGQQAKKIADKTAQLADDIKSAKPPRKGLDWALLEKKYNDAVKQYGRDAVDSLIKSDAPDTSALQTMGLTMEDGVALSSRANAARSAAKIADNAKKIEDDARTIATTAAIVGWTEGARVFSAVSATAGHVHTMFSALQGTATAPPGPLQYLAAVNAMFALGGSLQGAFGGGGDQGGDGLGRAINAIFSELRAIQRQLAEIQREQREHFVFIERNLNTLVQLAHVQAMGGWHACKSVLDHHDAWSKATQSSSLSSRREFLYGDLRQTGASHVAAQCVDWLWAADRSPIIQRSINPVYKSVVASVAQAADLQADATDQQFRQRYELFLQHYSGLLAVAAVEPAIPLGAVQTHWHRTPTTVPDIGTRAVQFGQPQGADWTFKRLTADHINTVAVVRSAEAAMLLAPVVDLIGPDGERDPGEALGSKRNETHYGKLVELHSLALAALASESLQAGTTTAQRIDLLLDEDDRVRRDDDVRNCLLQADSSSCLAQLQVISRELPDSCPEKIELAALRLCPKLGRARFIEVARHARNAVKHFPTLRQNVLAARMWRIGDRDKRSHVAMPSYRFALSLQTSASEPESKDLSFQLLRILFPNMSLRKLEGEPVTNGIADAYLTDGIYFSRLTGNCEGIRNKHMLLRTSCLAGQCDLVERDRKDGLGRELVRAKDQVIASKVADDDPNACVMASLPDPEEFEQGRVLMTEGLRTIERTADRLAVMLAYERTYRDTRLSNTQKWRIAMRYRPNIKSGSPVQ